MKVQELMTSAVETCTPTSDLASVAMTMWRQDCGIVPVVDESQRVLGVVTDRDICMAVATRHRRPEELMAGELMGDRVISARLDEDVRSALEKMRTERIRRLPVLDDQKRLRGILSMNDIVLGARPAGGQASPGVSANDVLAAFQGICAQRFPDRRRKPEEALVHA